MHTAFSSLLRQPRRATATNHCPAYALQWAAHLTSSMSAQLDHTCAVALCTQQDGSRVSVSDGGYNGGYSGG